MHQGEHVERFVTVVVRSVQQERVRWPHDVKYPIIPCDRNSCRHGSVVDRLENVENRRKDRVSAEEFLETLNEHVTFDSIAYEETRKDKRKQKKLKA